MFVCFELYCSYVSGLVCWLTGLYVDDLDLCFGVWPCMLVSGLTGYFGSHLTGGLHCRAVTIEISGTAPVTIRLH